MRASGAIPGDGFGDVFLVVDGWLTLRQEFEQLELDITALAARGLGYGIHVVAATNNGRSSGPQSRTCSAPGSNCASATRMSRRWAARWPPTSPSRPPGRGLTRDGLHFLTALPRIDGQPDASGLADAVRKLTETVAAAWPGPRAPEVRLLPGGFFRGGTARPGRPAPGCRSPWTRATLSPVFLDFAADPHFLVFGDTETGKSNLLHLIADGS